MCVYRRKHPCASGSCPAVFLEERPLSARGGLLTGPNPGSCRWCVEGSGVQSWGWVVGAGVGVEGQGRFLWRTWADAVSVELGSVLEKCLFSPSAPVCVHANTCVCGLVNSELGSAEVQVVG